VVYEWPYEDQHLAHVGLANDDHFLVELVGDGKPHLIPKPVYDDLWDSLRLAGHHHFCLAVEDIEASVAELRRRDVHILIPASSCR
jgi:hypothetical protein